VRALGAVLVAFVASAGAWAAPDPLALRVVEADGRVATVREVIGDHPAVVVFWATYCAPCRAEVPAVNRALERWRERGLRVLGVALETDPARVRAARREWDMQYDVATVADGQETTTDALFPRGLPAAALVANGKATLHERLLDDDALARLVPPLLEPAGPTRPSDTR
jgi:thiol-disulfide isomerase/thioredoxin